MPHFKKLFLFLLLLPAWAQAQRIVTTVAGTGVGGYSGDGYAASLAKICLPRDVAVDRYGNIYFSEMGNHIVRKLDTLGIITTIAGVGTRGYDGDGGPAIYAHLQSPIGIALDSIGNLFFVDHDNFCVRKVDTAGTITTIAGTGVAGYNGDGIAATAAEINNPGDVAVDTMGNVFLCDLGRIRKIDTSGVIATVAGTGTYGFSGDGIATAVLICPLSLVFDRNYNIYFTDCTNRVRKLTSSGYITTIGGTGSSGYSGDGGGATAANIEATEGIALDDTGNIYIGGQSTGKMRKISMSGFISRLGGLATMPYSGDGGDPLLANFSAPTGVAIGRHAEIYIADQGNHRIRCIGCKSPSGVESLEKHASGFQIEPNPSCGEFVLSIIGAERAGDWVITICDATGRTIEARNVETQSEHFKLTVKPGLYFITATLHNQSYTQQLIIE